MAKLKKTKRQKKKSILIKNIKKNLKTQQHELHKHLGGDIGCS